RWLFDKSACSISLTTALDRDPLSGPLCCGTQHGPKIGCRRPVGRLEFWPLQKEITAWRATACKNRQTILELARGFGALGAKRRKHSINSGRAQTLGGPWALCRELWSWSSCSWPSPLSERFLGLQSVQFLQAQFP